MTDDNLKGDIERQKYIIEELRKDNYKRFERINELKKENQKLGKKLQVVTSYLLSDECNLTDSQLRKIKKELEDV